MTKATTHLVHGLSLAVLLLAGGCSATNDGSALSMDGDVNNPIRVEPSYQDVKVTYYPNRGLAPADAPALSSFINDYRSHGNGSIIVSAPAGIAAGATLAYFTDRINEMGVARDHIIATTHDAPEGELAVDLNYVSYTARTNTCGNWTEDLSKTLDNSTPKNFGCAVQQNIAAMVSDPRDLLGPQPMDDADARRRAGIIDKYSQGQSTAADKSPDQSGTVSSVAK